MKLLITGVPGTGKSLISKKVAEIFNLKYINITEFSKENFEFPLMENELVIDEEKIEDSLLGMKNILIDSHIPFKADKAIILRCNPKVLLLRLQDRQYSREKIKDNILSEILDYSVYATKEIFKEDDIYEVLSEGVDETMERVVEILKVGGKSLKEGFHLNFLTEDNIKIIENL